MEFQAISKIGLPKTTTLRGRNRAARRALESAPPAKEIDKFTSQNDVTPLIDGPAVFASAREMVKSAQSVIQLEMYDLGHNEMVDLLCHEAKQGITVQVLLDPKPGINPSHTAAKKATVHKLKSNGVEVMYFPLVKDKKIHQIDHIKMLIVDGRSVLIGGMNWGVHSPVNHDADIKIEGQAVNYYRNVFNDGWKRSGGKMLTQEPPKAQPVPGKTGEIEGMGTEFKRANGIKRAVMRNIGKAQKSIHLECFVLSDREVIQGLMDAKQRGVEVKVLLDPTGVASNFSPNGKTFDALKEAGIEVKWYEVDSSKKQKLHAKWGVFDNEEMIIGSANWSFSGLQVNREIGAGVKDQPTVCAFDKQFAHDWENRATDKLPA